MFGENRFQVYRESQVWYHVVLFASFVLAIKLIPWVQGKIALYVSNEMIQPIATYGIVYLGAIYLLPEIGFMIVKSILDD